jgi:hypothetical protein
MSSKGTKDDSEIYDLRDWKVGVKADSGKGIRSYCVLDQSSEMGGQPRRDYSPASQPCPAGDEAVY